MAENSAPPLPNILSMSIRGVRFLDARCVILPSPIAVAITVSLHKCLSRALGAAHVQSDFDWNAMFLVTIQETASRNEDLRM